MLIVFPLVCARFDLKRQPRCIFADPVVNNRTKRVSEIYRKIITLFRSVDYSYYVEGV